jgi:hypothetical protein
MADKSGPDTRELLLDMLLQRVQEDRYPSVTMLNMAETLLRPEEVPLYVDLLIQRVREDTYPSIPMLKRIAALT